MSCCSIKSNAAKKGFKKQTTFSLLFDFFYKKWLTFSVRTSILNESVAIVTDSTECGVLAQLGEHLPYKQRVTGSSPVGPITFL